MTIPGVTVRSKVRHDERFDALGKLIGGKEAIRKETAIGVMTALWLEARRAQTDRVPLSSDTVERVGADNIVEAELGVMEGDMLILKGASHFCPQSKLPPPPDEAYELADQLGQLIAKTHPKHRVIAPAVWGKNRTRWAKVFELMSRIDQRPWTEMSKLLDWTKSHAFWSPNVLSAEKFRKHYDTLIWQRTNPRPEERTGNHKPQTADQWKSYKPTEWEEKLRKKK